VQLSDVVAAVGAQAAATTSAGTPAVISASSFDQSPDSDSAADDSAVRAISRANGNRKGEDGVDR
jgi:hypothetical protein